MSCWPLSQRFPEPLRRRLLRHITMNVDGLHRVGPAAAGLTIEMHGCVRDLVCEECKEVTENTCATRGDFRAARSNPAAAPRHAAAAPKRLFSPWSKPASPRAPAGSALHRRACRRSQRRIGRQATLPAAAAERCVPPAGAKRPVALACCAPRSCCTTTSAAAPPPRRPEHTMPLQARARCALSRCRTSGSLSSLRLWLVRSAAIASETPSHGHVAPSPHCMSSAQRGLHLPSRTLQPRRSKPPRLCPRPAQLPIPIPIPVPQLSVRRCLHRREDLILDEAVLDEVADDLARADLVLWLGISFQQSASTEHFRRARHALQARSYAHRTMGPFKPTSTLSPKPQCPI